MAWNSVHSGKTRFDMAESQLKAPYLKVDKKIVIELVCECLRGLNVKIEKEISAYVYNIDPKEIKGEDRDVDIDYKQFGLDDERDIVWIKFTSDGYVGVVAASNDVNFQIPPVNSTKDDYDRPGRSKKWKYNSSGIIIHYLKKKWDESFVLIFPIKNMPSGMTRHRVEKEVGNYLIVKNIAILDYYSHRIGGK